MGTHRAGPPADGDALPEPRPSRVRPAHVKEPAPAPAAPRVDDPGYPEDPPPPPAVRATGSGRSRGDRKAERLAKAERAVAEYARKDAERAARKATRRGDAPAAAPLPDPAHDDAYVPAPAAATSTDGWFQDTGDNPGPGSDLGTSTPRDKPGKAAGGAKPHQDKSRPPKARAPKPQKPPREPRPKDPRRRRRRAFLTGFSALGLAAAIGGGLAVANFAESAGGEGSVPAPQATMSAAALKQLTSVPAAVLDEVGAGSAVALLGRVDTTRLRAGNKPRLLYIGGESCPLCAAERWPLVVALSRFGTWSGLGVIYSPKEEVFPNTPTLTFHGATYTSKYLAFSAYETTSRVRTGAAYAPLDALSAADAEILRTVRVAPNVPAEATSRLPFLDLAGKFVGAGTHFRPQVIPNFDGLTHDQVAAALATPTSALAKAIDGGANAITAAICEVIPKATRPTEICSSSAVKAGKSIIRPKR